jgi:hypothetical protein
MAETVTRLPAPVNLQIYRGDDFGFMLLVTDEAGEPVELPGAGALAQVRATPDAAAVLASFDAFVDGNGITLRLTGDMTAVLPRRCVWDVEVILDGWVTTLAAGSMSVTPDVSRPVPDELERL